MPHFSVCMLILNLKEKLEFIILSWTITFTACFAAFFIEQGKIYLMLKADWPLSSVLTQMWKSKTSRLFFHFFLPCYLKYGKSKRLHTQNICVSVSLFVLITGYKYRDAFQFRKGLFVLNPPAWLSHHLHLFEARLWGFINKQFEGLFLLPQKITFSAV